MDMVLLFPWIRKIWNSHDLLDDSYWNVSIKSGEHVWSSQQNWEVNHRRLWLIISRTKMTSMQIGWWKTILSKLKTHAYSQGQTVGVGMVLSMFWDRDTGGWVVYQPFCLKWCLVGGSIPKLMWFTSVTYNSAIYWLCCWLWLYHIYIYVYIYICICIHTPSIKTG